jgi:hypothetical protein
MKQEKTEQIESEYRNLPRDIQLDLQDHANVLMSFRPLVEGVRTSEEQVEFSRGRNFVRTYPVPSYAQNNPEVEKYIGRLNSLFGEANSMVAENRIDVERMREILRDVDTMMYGKLRSLSNN